MHGLVQGMMVRLETHKVVQRILPYPCMYLILELLTFQYLFRRSGENSRDIVDTEKTHIYILAEGEIPVRWRPDTDSDLGGYSERSRKCGVFSAFALSVSFLRSEVCTWLS